MALYEELNVGTVVVGNRVRMNRAYTVAAPPANPKLGDFAFFSDGVAGGPGLAFYDGTNWKRVDTPATSIDNGES
jgi:hypothetical protein